MAWRGSLTRSLLSTARSAAPRTSSSSLPRARPPLLASPRVQRRRPSFAPSRYLNSTGNPGAANVAMSS